MKVFLQTAQMTLEACGTSPVLRINSFQQRREKVKVLVAQSCPTLCEPMHCSLLDSSIHGILQARILERVTVPFFSRSSLPRDQIQVSCICRQILTCLSHQIINQTLLLHEICHVDAALQIAHCWHLSFHQKRQRPATSPLSFLCLPKLMRQFKHKKQLIFFQLYETS